jgi:hypothetical protein
MAYLFKIESNLVVPSDESLLIPPYKDIWDRDTSKNKDTAYRELTYVEFMSSQLSSNPYKGYAQSVRGSVIIKDIFKGEAWTPDALVLEAVKKIEQFQMDASPSYSSYSSGILAKEKVDTFLRTVELTKINFKTGMPLYKPKEITTALLDLDKVAMSLENLRKKVEEELFEAVKTKGQKEISPFAKT